LARQGAFKSEKRKKEVLRLKKQEEKRQKRLRKDAGLHQETEGTSLEETVTGESSLEETATSETAPEKTAE
jgi:hypothetical protein